MSQFDEIINRKGIFSQKWEQQGGDYIPMWVADMDFRTPAPIEKALHQRIEKGTFGFSFIDEGAYQAIIDYYRKEHQCEVRQEWIVWVPSVMPACNLACRIAGGDLMIQVPMYPHIRRLSQEAHVGIREVPLRCGNGYYEMDFEAMEQACDGKVKSFVMSNPHNPVGRTFKREELIKLKEFCRAHSLLLISDEIHCDLVFEGKHIPYFALDEEARESSITVTSASKTYNIPSIPYAFAIIPNPQIRERFEAECYGLFPPVGVLGIEALKAAYRDCGEWHKELLAYLRTNRDYLEKRIAAIPGLSVTHNEATYLAWVDARQLPVEDPQKFFRDAAGVYMNDGKDFGADGFVRLNFGCPKSQLKQALDQIEAAVTAL